MMHSQNGNGRAIRMNWQTLQYASIMALGGTILAFWSTVKSVISRMSTYVVVQSKWTDGNSGQIMQYYFQNHFKKSPFGIRNFFTGAYFLRPRDRVLFIAFESLAGASIYWKGWRPLWFTVGEDANKNPTNNFQVSFIRGTFNMENLFCEAVEYWNKLRVPDTRGKKKEPAIKRNNRFAIFYVFGHRASADERNKKENSNDGQPMGAGGTMAQPSSEPPDTLRPLRWKRDQIGMPLLPQTCSRPTDMMILSPDVQEAVDEAVFWLESEQWYKDRHIPWKRGWLLYGKPGTGKTSLARAIAQELDLPIWVFDLASLTNEELREGWRKMSQTAPCMALLEDIDGTFDGRVNVAVEGKYREGLTFDCLLNCIDGVERVNGVLVVVTTNKIKTVDPAIGIPQSDGSSSRPGRIDRVIEMREPDRDGLMRVAKRILDKNPECWDTMVDEAFAKRQTVCQFQEKCAQVALKNRWKMFRLRFKKPDEKVVEEDEVYDGPVLRISETPTASDPKAPAGEEAPDAAKADPDAEPHEALINVDPCLRAVKADKVRHVGRPHPRRRYYSCNYDY